MREFLSIDHVSGGGQAHRAKVTGHKNGPIIPWIIKNDFPDMLQILCHNCNMAKSSYGKCPHLLMPPLSLFWEVLS